MRYLFRLRKENQLIKYVIVRDIRIALENEEEENYDKLVRVNNFWSNIYIEHESNSHRNKTLSVEEYLNKIRSYLKGIINNLKNLTRGKFNYL